MGEHPNVVLHKKVHEAASTGDMETLTAMVAEETVWHSHGKSQIAGDFHGRDTVFAKFFGQMGELSGGTDGFLDHQDYLGSETQSVALFRWTATRGGKTQAFRVCEVIRWENGQIVEEWSYYEDQYGWDEFWS